MANTFDEREFDAICQKLNTAAYVKDITIKYERSGFFEKVRTSIQRDRRGEVVFCVIRPGGKVVTVTCSDYPEGVYRIPTGGIGHREDIVEAVFREAREELGLETGIIDFPGVVRIRFEYKDQYVMFYSYIFILREKSGRLLEDATDNEVSCVREVGTRGLSEVLASLAGVQGMWNDWARFRYVTTNEVLEYLERNTGRLGICRGENE